MTEYDPLDPPDSEEWLSSDEQLLIVRVRRYHEREAELPPDANAEMHAILHVVVENQIAHGDEWPVAETVDRLMAEGLDRHQAIHALSGELVKSLWMNRTEVDEVLDQGAEMDVSAEYFEKVKNLTAEEWLDGAGDW